MTNLDVASVGDGIAPVRDAVRSIPEGPSVARDSDAWGFPGLTHRQSEVLRMCAQGMSTIAMACALGVTPHTVKWHVATLLKRLVVGVEDPIVHGAAVLARATVLRIPPTAIRIVHAHSVPEDSR